MNDLEREEQIRDCGKQMEICMAAGDKEKAHYWLQQMQGHIAQRSPEQIARMEAKLGLTPEPYFLNKGEEDRAVFVRRQVA